MPIPGMAAGRLGAIVDIETVTGSGPRRDLSGNVGPGIIGRRIDEGVGLCIADHDVATDGADDGFDAFEVSQGRARGAIAPDRPGLHRNRSLGTVGAVLGRGQIDVDTVADDKLGARRRLGRGMGIARAAFGHRRGDMVALHGIRRRRDMAEINAIAAAAAIEDTGAVLAGGNDNVGIGRSIAPDHVAAARADDLLDAAVGVAVLRFGGPRQQSEVHLLAAADRRHQRARYHRGFAGLRVDAGNGHRLSEVDGDALAWYGSWIWSKPAARASCVPSLLN